MSCVNPDQTKRPMFVLAEQCEANPGRRHAHRRAQLIHASEGVLTVRTEHGLWVVPPQRAVWVPPKVVHQVGSRKSFHLCTLYVEPDAAQLPQECCVVAVDRLVGELLMAASEFGSDYPEQGPQARLMQVILDRLPGLEVAPLNLPQPQHPRIRHIAKVLDDDPADERTLEALAKDAGVAGRTAARLFQKDTGLSFGKWRQQLRLLKALESLGAGASVMQAALDVGYNDVSSFIAVFRDAFGETPARYFR